MKIVNWKLSIVFGALLLAGLFLWPIFKKPALELEPASVPVSQIYHDPVYNFSLELPPGFSWQTYDEGEGGATTAFHDEKREHSFQVAVSPFDGEPVLTRERILQDLPSTVIKDPKEVVIGDNQHALLFESEDPAIGKTREVWFINNGYLYAITTYARLDAWLAGIMKTWKML